MLGADPAEVPVHAGYALEIVDAAGKRVWGASGLVRSPTDDFTLTLLEPLPRGAYTVQLYGLDGGRRTPLASYPFRVR